MADLQANGMYKDGSNPENVEPSPPLSWASKEDFKEVVVHGMRISPAVCKLLAFLKYYQVPFTFKKTFGKKGSKYYKKMPVMDVAGRQVNDTFIILKNMVPALAGSFDMEWETRITYHYQMSTVYLITNDEAKLNMGGKGGDSPLPKCMLCLLPKIRKGPLKGLKAKMDDPKEIEQLVDLTEFAKELAGTMGDKPFFLGAETPGPVDISFYGVNARFVFCKVDTIIGALQGAGLMPWFQRMEELIPLSGKPDAMFENPGA